MCGHSPPNCGQKPVSRKTASSAVRIERPQSVASPEVGRTSPVSMLIEVVLPAPLGPSRAKQLPARTPNVSDSTATVDPPLPVKTFRRARTRTQSASAADSLAPITRVLSAATSSSSTSTGAPAMVASAASLAAMSACSDSLGIGARRGQPTKAARTVRTTARMS